MNDRTAWTETPGPLSFPEVEAANERLTISTTFVRQEASQGPGWQPGHHAP
jgi:hypothetical protein